MDILSPKKIYNDLLAKKLIAEFAAHNIDGYYCEKKTDVLAKVLEIIPKGSLVSSGGSATLRELDLAAALKKAGCNFLDTDDVQGGQAKEQMAHQALGADYYLMSANAIAASGEIVTLDGIGNRAAALSFGPRHVILIAGLNKVEPTLEAAVLRAKTYAAAHTLLLFKRDYASYDELMTAAENSWGHTLITRMSVFKGRIQVLLVGEDLGY